MIDLVSLGVNTLLSPVVLSFALGIAAGALRSDLAVPEAIGRALAIYLMFAIGLKGGAAVATEGDPAAILAAMLAGAALSFAMPVAAFWLLRTMTRLSPIDAAAVSAHYGSVSVVTFVTGTQVLASMGLGYEGYMVAVLAVMESPAIISGLILARTVRVPDMSAHAHRPNDPPPGHGGAQNGVQNGALWREILLNASVVLLVGGFLIGLVVGPSGVEPVAPLFVDLFTGLLCLFLLDMGLLVARQARRAGRLGAGAVGFALFMPLIGSAFGLGAAGLLGLSAGGAFLMAVLAASASYIAVPAAMRLALPEANPAIYVTLSLAVTFPFNLVIGLPLYFSAVRALGFG